MKIKFLPLAIITLVGAAVAENLPSQENNPVNQNIEQIKRFFRSVSPQHLKQVAEQSQTEKPSEPVSSPEPSPVMEQEEAAPIPISSETHFWNLEQTDIRAVINEVSKMTGKNFLIDPRVQGRLTLVSNAKIADKDIYPVFLSMLQVAGFTAIEQDHITKIMPIMDGRTDAVVSNPLLNKTIPGDELMVQVIPVNYVSADQLVPVLRPMLPQWSTVASYSPSNMLILSGRAVNIRQIANIIRQVDSSSINGIDIIPLKHALAMDVHNTLQSLYKNQTAAGTRNPPVIAADDRGNAILLSGNKTDRIRLRLLITELDQKSSTSNQTNTQVVYLNYMRAEDLVPILAGIAQASFSGVVGTTIGTVTQPQLDSSNPAASMIPNPSSGSIPSNPMVATGGGQNTGQAANTNVGSSNQNEGSSKPSVQIIGEPNTNSIIMNGPVAILRNLKKVIHQLDIKPAQLLVEAMVAEIDADEITNLGITWGSNFANSANPNLTPGLAVINSTYSVHTLQANIYALYTEQKANILSTPSVVVLDNRQAKILIGKQVSVASSSYPNNASGTTTASPYTTYDRVNVALHLYVRPQITRDGGIQLQIDQGNDTLQSNDALNPGDLPVFNISAIVTSVHVKSGNIIVLGGLAQEQLNNDNTDVPILKDIPGVGRFFQRNGTRRQKKVLMVFIRPFIMQNNNDVALFSSGKYQHLRQDQLKLAREQEVFDERNRDTVSPPWHSEVLPKPFDVKTIQMQK